MKTLSVRIVVLSILIFLISLVSPYFLKKTMFLFNMPVILTFGIICSFTLCFYYFIEIFIYLKEDI